MDFFKIKTKVLQDRETKEKYLEIYPSYIVQRCEDLMVRGRTFYAIWDEKKQLWSTDEYDVPRLVDQALYDFRDEFYPPETTEMEVRVSTLRNSDTERWAKFKRYVYNLSDNDHVLNDRIIFSDQEVVRSDYASFKLDYACEPGDHSAWDRIIGTLYEPEEREKLEWGIGAIIRGDAREIQKFMVLYGDPGTGKGTIMGLLQEMFKGYVAIFDAKALGMRSSQFATSVFANNPLVAIQQDGDLSRIEDNTILNTIVSHEDVIINEKNQPTYSTRVKAFLFMGTNSPVKISDSSSGLIRGIIVVTSKVVNIPGPEYRDLMRRVHFEYGAIAHHCLEVYDRLGFHYYDDYRPYQMMYQTDDIRTFFTDNYDVFSGQKYTTVRQAYTMYLEFCEENGIAKPVPRKILMNEMSSYFTEYHERVREGDQRLRSVYSGFHLDNNPVATTNPTQGDWLELSVQPSQLDEACSEMFAQYATSEGIPKQKWDDVKTHLSDVDTGKLHYVAIPEDHIVIDFDLKDEDGEKSLERNLEAASKFPKTYAEVSKSGGGLHLHYIYSGDTSRLDSVYSEDIEVKVYRGRSSLRRQLTLCNSEKIATISSGLPLKEEAVTSEKTIRSEKSLRTLIDRNIRKEIHSGTRPSVQFILKILEDAYESGLKYDLTDMRGVISMFAANSTNHATECIRMVREMKFQSDGFEDEDETTFQEEASIAFFDVEVYPNLFLVGWKTQGKDNYTPMINPSPQAIEELFKFRLVGFNNRSYDNHMVYAAYLGYNNEQLYELSQKIISNDNSAKFGEAWGLSYADVYDFSAKKQSLKAWEIELGIKYMEMDIPWDQPVPDELIDKVIEYNKNDVDATEAVWEAQAGAFAARKVLAELSGYTVNDSTRKHAAKIIFGNDRNPQKQFVYTNLATGETE